MRGHARGRWMRAFTRRQKLETVWINVQQEGFYTSDRKVETQLDPTVMKKLLMELFRDDYQPGLISFVHVTRFGVCLHWFCTSKDKALPIFLCNFTRSYPDEMESEA